MASGYAGVQVIQITAISIVAGIYGGGGHARAAGFRVPRTHELARA